MIMSGFTKQKIPIIGGIFHKFPIYHRESYLINLMGYQIVRILLFRTKRFFRALSKGAKSSQLDGKGYYSQDNCLSPELFAEIQKYIKELRVKAKGRECYPYSSGDFSFRRWDLKLSKELKKKVFNDLGNLSSEVSAYLGIHKKFVPTFSILGLRKITAD